MLSKIILICNILYQTTSYMRYVMLKKYQQSHWIDEFHSILKENAGFYEKFI